MFSPKKVDTETQTEPTLEELNINLEEAKAALESQQHGIVPPHLIEDVITSCKKAIKDLEERIASHPDNQRRPSAN